MPFAHLWGSSAKLTSLPLVSASQTRLRNEAGASFDPCNSPTNTQRTDFLLHIWSAPGMAEHEANATAELIANAAPHLNPTNRLMKFEYKRRVFSRLPLTPSCGHATV